MNNQNMGKQNWISLFYDKCAGRDDHGFNNELTKSILEDDLTKDEGFICILGKSAIESFNAEFDSSSGTNITTNFTIPDLDPKLYKVKLYTKKINSIPIYITVVDVNSTYLEKIIDDKEEIPQKIFLSELFKRKNYYVKYRNNC